MFELIMTVVVPATKDEPAHTLVYRYEYDATVDIDDVLQIASEKCIDGGQMAQTIKN
jgi:hypothetical protein